MTVEHTDVGAYALGLLDPGDKQEFEQHLAGCSWCTAELSSMSGMASLLADVKPTPPAPAPVVDLMRARARTQRRRSRRLLVGGIAAGVALLATGGVVGTTLGDHRTMGPAEHLIVMGPNIVGTDPSTKVKGTVALETKGWGTHVALKLENVRGPIANCRLVAVDASGHRETITNWGVPKWGYGTPKSPDPLFVHGGTATKKAKIERLVVEDLTNRRDLVTIEV